MTEVDMMKISSTPEMLDTIEFLHYARKFSGEEFLVVFNDRKDQHRFDLDIHSLASAGIKVRTMEASVTGYDPDLIISLCNEYGIARVIFVGQYEPLKKDDRVQGYCSPDDIDGRELKYLINGLIPNSTKVVLLNNIPGSLHQEVFTYFGSGTLIGENLVEQIKPAVIDDAESIFFMLRHYMEKGIILPISFSELTNDIENFLTLKVDEHVVAFLRTKEYGNACEIGKLCTLPRYRKMGLSTKLIQDVVKSQQTRGCDYLFALSEDDDVLESFRKNGFTDIHRQDLPVEWQDGYDFSRKSKAVKLEL